MIRNRSHLWDHVTEIELFTHQFLSVHKIDNWPARRTQQTSSEWTSIVTYLVTRPDPSDIALTKLLPKVEATKLELDVQQQRFNASGQLIILEGFSHRSTLTCNENVTKFLVRGGFYWGNDGCYFAFENLPRSRTSTTGNTICGSLWNPMLFPGSREEIIRPKLSQHIRTVEVSRSVLEDKFSWYYWKTTFDRERNLFWRKVYIFCSCTRLEEYSGSIWLFFCP